MRLHAVDVAVEVCRDCVVGHDVGDVDPPLRRHEVDARGEVTLAVMVAVLGATQDLPQVPDLILEPDETTRKTLDNLNLLFRSTDEGYNVYYDTTLFRKDQLDAYMGKKITFLLSSSDDCFQKYTLLPTYTNDSVFYFTNSGHTNKPLSSLPLAAGKYAGKKDLVQLIPSTLRCLEPKTNQKSKIVLTDPFNNAVSPSSANKLCVTYNNLEGFYFLNQYSGKTMVYANSYAYRTKPLAVIELYLFEKHIETPYSVFENGKIIPKNFTIDFDSRSAKWRYYVVNKTNTKVNNLSIASIDNKIMFVNKGKTTMLKFPTSVIISKAALKMQLYSDKEFNLAIKSGNGNSILENILIPSAESLTTENKTNFIDAYIFI